MNWGRMGDYRWQRLEKGTEGRGLPRHHRCMCFENIHQPFHKLLIRGFQNITSVVTTVICAPTGISGTFSPSKAADRGCLSYVFHVRSASIRLIMRIGGHIANSLSVFLALIIHVVSTRRHASSPLRHQPTPPLHCNIDQIWETIASPPQSWISSLSPTKFWTSSLTFSTFRRIPSTIFSSRYRLYACARQPREKTTVLRGIRHGQGQSVTFWQ